MYIKVISIATPEGLVRVIQPTYQPGLWDFKKLVQHAVEAVGMINLKDTEWRGAIYTAPDYISATKDAFLKTKGGIYLYPWVSCNEKYAYYSTRLCNSAYDTESVWNDATKRYTIPTNRTLLFKPAGWI